MSGKGSNGLNGHGKPRRHPGVKGLSPHLKAMRQREAQERNAKWAKLTLEQQLNSLEDRFPKGAAKQKAKLRTRIEAAKSKPLETPTAKKDRVENDAKKLSSREKKQQELRESREGS